MNYLLQKWVKIFDGFTATMRLVPVPRIFGSLFTRKYLQLNENSVPEKGININIQHYPVPLT